MLFIAGNVQQLSPIDVAGADTDNTVNEFLDQMNLSFFAQMSVSLIMCTLSSTRIVKQEVLINPIAEDRGIVTALKSKLPLKHYKVSSPTFQALLTGRLEWDEYRLRLLWVVTTKTERHAGLVSTANRYHIASFMYADVLARCASSIKLGISTRLNIMPRTPSNDNDKDTSTSRMSNMIIVCPLGAASSLRSWTLGDLETG